MNEKNVYNILIGLVIGAVLPIALFLVLLVADGILVNFLYRYFRIGFGLRLWQLCILLVPIEMVCLFFIARLNKALAVAALSTAIITTVCVIYFAVTMTPFAPS